MKKGDVLKHRVGESNFNTQGLKMTIINYISSKYIDVLFECNGEIKRTRYCHFLSGKVRCQYFVSKTQQKINNRIKNIEFLQSKIKDGTAKQSSIYPNYYIDTQGTVYNKKGRKLKPQKTKGGYYVVDLPNNNRNHNVVLVHRLVAMAFIPNPDNLPEVNHKDTNKLNNKVENLEWCTKSQNQKHKFLNLNCSLKGSQKVNSKLKEKDVFNIIQLRKDGFSNRYIGNIYNISPSVVSSIYNNKAWTHVNR